MSLKRQILIQTEKKINKTVNGVQSTSSHLEHQAQNNGFSILRGLFAFDATREPELLYIEADEEAIIMQNGIHFINSSLFCPEADGKTGAAPDNDFRELVESVMNNPISSKSGD
jgi:hypothetical protein